MKFDFNLNRAFFALAVVSAGMAFIAAVVCGIKENYVGAIISGIVTGAGVFAAAGLYSEDDVGGFDDE